MVFGLIYMLPAILKGNVMTSMSKVLKQRSSHLSSWGNLQKKKLEIKLFEVLILYIESNKSTYLITEAP